VTLGEVLSFLAAVITRKFPESVGI